MDQSPVVPVPELPEKRTYRVEEIAQLLDISKSSAYTLVKQGHFPMIRIGTTIRVSKKSFDDWLDQQITNE